jgi:hypothetical protein
MVKVRDQDRHAGRTDGGRAAQQPKPPWPGLQNFTRINRKQSHRPAEQHPEQIQRDRSKDDFTFPDIVKPRQDGF